MKIRQTILIGAGGTGGWLAEPLSRLLAFHDEANPTVTVVDRDRFELTNMDRQASASEGRNKAAALTDRMVGRAVPMAAYIDGEDLQSIIADRDYEEEMTRADGVVCIILAVDNDFTRGDVIRAMEESPHDYLIVNPGNEYETFMLSVQARVHGHKIGGSLRSRFSQYVDPPLDAPQHRGCKEEEPSAPQLLTANMGAAWAALSAVEAWLSDSALPLGLDGRTRDARVTNHGSISLPGWAPFMEAINGK